MPCSVWCLSVSCFQSSARCSLSINRTQASSDRANCIPRVGGLRSPEASASTRAIAYGAWRREVMCTHSICLSRALLFTKACSALGVKSRRSLQRVLSQLGSAAQCLTCSMCQFEALGASSLLKLLVTHLWTLFWTVLFICVTWLDSFLLPTKICSVLDVKPRLSRQHVLSQLETTAQYSTHTMYKHLRQDEDQL